MIEVADKNQLEYSIDHKDRIITVSQNWQAFAQENDASLPVVNVIGRSLWDFISDESTRELYKALLRKVRYQGGYVTIPFRCDSPTTRRYLQLQLSADFTGTVYFKSYTLKTEPRSAAKLLDCNEQRSDNEMTICSWCKQIKLGDDFWVDIEFAIDKLSLFNGDGLPELVQSTCTACQQRLVFTLNMQSTHSHR